MKKKIMTGIMKGITRKGIVIFLLAGLLCGCSNHKVDYRLDDTGAVDTEEEESGKKSESETSGGTSESEESSFGLSQFAGAEHWKEDWIQTREDGSTLDIQIDTDIVVPDTDHMSVVEIREIQMDTAYEEQVIKAFFGDAGVLPYDNSDWNPGQGDAYTGERNGTAYILKFRMEDREGNKRNDIIIGPTDIKTVLPEEANTEGNIIWSAANLSLTGEEGENLCILSQQEAVNMAEQLLEDMGVSMILKDAGPLYWYRAVEDTGSMEEIAVNGYYLTYEAGISGIFFPDFGIESNYKSFTDAHKDAPWQIYSLNSQADFVVTDEGVIDMRICYPVEITKVTKEVELLPIEKIQSIIHKELTENSEQFALTLTGSHTKLKLTSMELIYFRVRDDSMKGYYSYIPAWRLSGTFDSDLSTYANVILVNAIDGSVIDLLEEVQ